MKKNRLNPRDFSFLTFSVISLMMLGLSTFNPILNQKFDRMMLGIVGPLAELSKKPGEASSSIFQSIQDYVGVAHENEQLKEELKELRQFRNEVLHLRHENTELKHLLQMQEDTPGSPISTRLLMDGGSPFNRSAIVNVGENQGITRGNEVVNEEGLIGRVVEVYPNRSRILLMTDYTFRLPVRILESRVQGIVRGTNGRWLELMLLEKEVDVDANMTVVTSGAGGVFSEGIPVGGTYMENGKMFIVPDVDFSRLGVVSIQRRKMEGILNEISE